MREERTGIMWWKAGVWRLKGLRRGFEIRMYPVQRKEEELWHILECKWAKGWREIILEKIIRNFHPAVGIQRLAWGRITENWHKTRAYSSKFKEKWEQALKKYVWKDVKWKVRGKGR
jgi:hypothetical protein